jgi:hypothetical protein
MEQIKRPPYLLRGLGSALPFPAWLALLMPPCLLNLLFCTGLTFP